MFTDPLTPKNMPVTKKVVTFRLLQMDRLPGLSSILVTTALQPATLKGLTLQTKL